MVNPKIIGTESCTHIDNKTGLHDCEKVGRLTKKVTWNKDRKHDTKRAYAYFIHNDGTTHYLGLYDDYRLNQMKINGNPLGQVFKELTGLGSIFHETGHQMMKIYERDLSRLNLTDYEKMDLTNGLRYIYAYMEQVTRLVKLSRDSMIFVLQKEQEPPQEIMDEMIEAVKSIRHLLKDDKINLYNMALGQIYNKYIQPERRKKRNMINRKISETKMAVPKSGFLE
jgi:hypothetical protein